MTLRPLLDQAAANRLCRAIQYRDQLGGFVNDVLSFRAELTVAGYATHLLS
jgi:hypothetical protein